MLSRQIGSGKDKSGMECSGGREDVQEPQPPLISIMGDAVDPFGSSDSELDQSVLPYSSEESTHANDNFSDTCGDCDECEDSYSEEDSESCAADGGNSEENHDTSEDDSTAESRVEFTGTSRSGYHGRGRGLRGCGVARGQIRGTRGRSTRIGGTSRGHQIVRQSG